MTTSRKLCGVEPVPITAEYECPVHGRFSRTVRRPAPVEMSCPVVEDSYHNCEDPPCSDCGFTVFQCKELSPWCSPSSGGCVKLGEDAQGKGLDFINLVI
jgi:hypothetical protein